MSLFSTCVITEDTKRTKGEEPTESTDWVPAKDPLKAKSVTEESPITLKVWELGNFTFLREEEAWHLYGDVGQTKIPWT